MYPIESTKGFIISINPRKEADNMYKIFTKDFGMIFTTAQSSRKEASKLRGSLERYAISEVSFISGKGGYRMTGANKLYSLSDIGYENTKAVEVMVGLSRLLKKLCPESEIHESIFQIVQDAYIEVIERKDDKEFLENLEILFVIKILQELGYWDDRHDSINIDKIKENKKTYRGKINHSLQISHL
jgi:DNA repair protein RecO